MILSLTKKFLYIHIPKTGGISISTSLQAFDSLWNRSRAEKLIEKLSRQNYIVRKRSWLGQLQSLARIYSGHQRLDDVHRAIPQDIYQQLFRFAFVRNPYAIAVSAFHFIKGCKSHHQYPLVNKYQSFSSLVKDGWQIPNFNQVDYIRNDFGQFDMHFVGRLETIKDDFDLVKNKLNLGNITLEHLNSTDTDHWREYYDNETYDIITKRYEKDLKFLGYQFDSFDDDLSIIPARKICEPDKIKIHIPL